MSSYGLQSCLVLLMLVPLCVQGGFYYTCQDPVYCGSSASSTTTSIYEPCWNTTCHNGGTCITYNTYYKCLCPTNTKGEHCEAVERTITYPQTMSMSECVAMCDETNSSPSQWMVQCPNVILSNNGTCSVIQQPVQALEYVYQALVRVGEMPYYPMATPQSDGYWDESSEANVDCRGWRARLNIDYSSGCDGWRSLSANSGQWLQVRWDNDIIVNRIAIQPRRDAHEWIKTYKIRYHTGIIGQWTYYTEPDENNVRQTDKIIDAFTTNPASLNSISYYDLQRPLLMNYLRIHVETWYSYPAARIEVYGFDVDLVS